MQNVLLPVMIMIGIVVIHAMRQHATHARRFVKHDAMKFLAISVESAWLGVRLFATISTAIILVSLL